ncbi:dimethylaniline monooxygenase [N-oxide-forming] 5-like [Limulus polyphemus]|uniref:Flavin-containing monooxygenase n=1 Tax=Limulus polyphemus TaxID=6850 RepID=A0ABM1SB15_LIMPO|nr:dimethylaniline monooxygenase [N-oxide-forming] 5-like [Limulus polyphemus]
MTLLLRRGILINMTENRRICIIGAGSSGLTSIKACLEEGLQPFCYEKTDHLGGLWRYRDNDLEGVASVMKSTIINTSKEINAYSDFPPPKEFPNYMHNSYMIRYIEMYAEEFDLARHIHFRHEILKVEENHDFDETGRWKVAIRNIEEDQIFDDVFDGVMVCIGHHVYPHVPTFPGIEKFKGKVLHTHSYKKPDGFSDKRIVIVGIGNSGGDVAVELSQITDKVYLSTRRGCWIIHRVGPDGLPFDATFLRRYWNMMWQSIPYKLLCYLSERYINKRFNHEIYNIKPDHRIFGQHPMVNDSLPNRILSGTVILKGNIKEFTQNGVIFEGEEREYEVDVVILATGYKIKFPFVDKKIFYFKDNKVDLYKYVVSPKLKHPSLAFIALAQTVGALFPVGEIQARWFALLMTKKVELPPVNKMVADIKKKRDDMAKKYFESSRNTIQVDWIPYMDEISSLISAKPKLFHLLLTDPILLWHCIFGPCLPYQYRLNGPHSWVGARNAILTYEDRIIGALKTRNSSKTKEPVQSQGLWKLLKIILYIILIVFIFYMIF